MNGGGRSRARRRANVLDGVSLRIAATTSWLAMRPEPWFPCRAGPAVEARLDRPAPPLGVAILMFVVGPGAQDWSERLARSSWYSAIRPRPADLAGRGPARGTLPSPNWSRFPEARLATLALMDGASAADVDAAFGLVQALGKGVKDEGHRLRVVVTMGAAEPSTAADLRHLGATVIRGTAGMDPDHLHHFPVRAALRPPSGRLVCVDLADCLMCWPPGRIGDLHLIPFNAGSAKHALCGITVPQGLTTATVIAQGPHEGSDSDLSALDLLAGVCGEFLFGTNGVAPMLFTNGDRLDGATGTADLLLIHGDS